MTIYAYVRVSDADKQNASTQKNRIKDYAIEHALIINDWQSFEASGSKTDRNFRGITALLDQLKSGDHILVSDVDRLGRTSISDIVEIITRIINTGATLHLCYSGNTIGPNDVNDLAKIFMSLGEAYAAVKGAQERSHKATAAAARRKHEGLPNGRKKGAFVASLLDGHESDIVRYKAEGLSEYTIAKQLEVARSTLRRWIEQRTTIIEQAKAKELWNPGISITQLKKRLNAAL